MKVKQFTQTTYACPSQWEGVLEDGRFFYARYRWGMLSVRASNLNPNGMSDAYQGMEVITEQIGGDLDGVMDTEQLKEIMIRHGFSFTDTTFLV